MILHTSIKVMAMDDCCNDGLPVMYSVAVMVENLKSRLITFLLTSPTVR